MPRCTPGRMGRRYQHLSGARRRYYVGPPGRRPDALERPARRDRDRATSGYINAPAGAPARRHAASSRRCAANGQVIEMLGRALPGGGYVTSYSDITDLQARRT